MRTSCQVFQMATSVTKSKTSDGGAVVLVGNTNASVKTLTASESVAAPALYIGEKNTANSWRIVSVEGALTFQVYSASSGDYVHAFSHVHAA